MAVVRSLSGSLVKPLASAITGASGGAAGLLLDIYPSAAAAYSVARKLRTAYTGDAIRVRRSSDDAEQDVGFDGSGNLDESALTTFVGANDGYVVTLYDQSGNAVDATQATASKQPKIVASGVVVKENGVPAIEFDSTDDNLVSSVWSTNTSGDWAFTVYAYDSLPESGQLWTNGQETLPNPNGFGVGVGGTTHEDVGSNFVGVFDGVRWMATSLTLTTSQTLLTHTIIPSTNAQTVYINSSAEVVAGNAGDAMKTPTTSSKLGGSEAAVTRYVQAKIQEHIFYASDQSTNRAAIEANIGDYYGITLA